MVLLLFLRNKGAVMFLEQRVLFVSRELFFNTMPVCSLCYGLIAVSVV